MKRWSVFIGLMLACACLFGQGEITLRPLPDYDFAHFNRNKIVYPSGDSMAMEHFFIKMDSVINYGIGNVNILHIGGSLHTTSFTLRVNGNIAAMQSNAKPTNAWD